MVQVCLGGKGGEKGQELIQMVIHVSESGKFYAALCTGGYPLGDLQAAVVMSLHSYSWGWESCQWALLADMHARMLFAFRTVRTSLAVLAHFQLPPKTGHRWGLAGQKRGGQFHRRWHYNWDMSVGTLRDGRYVLWEPFWNSSSQGLVGIPQGASVAWKSYDYGTEWHPVVCASKARWEGGARSCLDEADKLRSSLCLLKSGKIPNPRSTSCSDGSRCSAQDHGVVLAPAAPWWGQTV